MALTVLLWCYLHTHTRCSDVTQTHTPPPSTSSMALMFSTIQKVPWYCGGTEKGTPFAKALTSNQNVKHRVGGAGGNKHPLLVWVAVSDLTRSMYEELLLNDWVFRSPLPPDNWGLIIKGLCWKWKGGEWIKGLNTALPFPDISIYIHSFL